MWHTSESMLLSLSLSPSLSRWGIPLNVYFESRGRFGGDTSYNEEMFFRSLAPREIERERGREGERERGREGVRERGGG